MIYFILFCSAFLSATLFPFGSEALFIYDIKNGYNIYLLLFFATFGNTFGSVVNYFLGKKGEEFLEKKSLVKSKYIKKSKNYFQKYGFLTLFLSWMPIIGDPITFIAGVLKYNFKKFLLIVTIAKFSRYFFIYLIL
jgi:membrane protein YqaA with SNARE-associated domain